MLTLIAFLVVIGVLVFVHELGHLIAAKSVDIEVPRFSIGFGPRLVGFTRGETEYVISALPLGGYVKMAGMEDMAALEGGAEPERAPSGREFDSKPLWARIWVVTAGVIMNFLFAILVFAGVGVFYGEPVNPITRVVVAAPAEGLPPAAAPLAAVPFGAEITAVAGEPVESWNDIAERLVEAPAGPVTLQLRDAPPVTLTLPADDSARVQVLRVLEPYTPPVLGQIETGSPADRAGLQPDDRILAAGGQPVRTWTEFVEIVRASPGEPLALQLQRDGATRAVTVTPDSERELNVEMERVEVGRLGVGSRVEIGHRRLGPGEALARGATVTWETSVQIVGLLGDLFTGDASPRTLGGPLAIGQLSGQAARGGLEIFFGFMALLSVNLAVLNLLPIPVLDGGQLLFLIVEGIRGRPLSVEQRLRLSNVGLIMVVGIMVWAITNDFLRFFGI